MNPNDIPNPDASASEKPTSNDSQVLAELQPLLDALCEETIAPPQLARLEELVLAHPEAEQHYVRFMSFHADLIGAIAGLPERTIPGAPSSKATADTPAPAMIALPVAHTERLRVERTKSKRIWRYLGPALLIVLIFGGIATYQGVNCVSAYRDVSAHERALKTKQDELAKAQQDYTTAQHENRKELDAAIAAERELARIYRSALVDAGKRIADRDYRVRVSGPEHLEPGAPNKWQIETLRPSGAVARPKQLQLAVKDEKDNTLYRLTQINTVGATTLELPVSVWTKVKSGSDLFLEVSAPNEPAERIPLARPVYVTHLATDKPLYQPGETVRFRSLSLNRATLRPPPHDLHLRFRLREPSGSVVVLGEGNGRLLRDLQPILGPDGKPLRGIGVGEFTLNADAPGGEYALELVEVTAAGDKEVLLETRKFIVNRYVPDTFEKKLEFDAKSYGAGDVVQARIEVSRTAGGPMKDARASVVASVDGREIHTQQDQRFTIATDAGSPKAVLNVRFKLPADLFEKKDAPSAALSVTIRDGSDAEAIVRPIPLVTKTLWVEFFPEGGDMIEGVPGRVYFQVRTPRGKPADLKGIITDGPHPQPLSQGERGVIEVATVTDADHEGVNRGHGVFMLTPRPGAKYYLKLTSPAGITAPTKDGFPLPAAKTDGVVLTALEAVTGRGAPVRLKLQVGQGTKTLHVGAYARGRLIGQQKVEVAVGRPVDVAIPGDPAAAGVTRVTVFEELPGEPGASATGVAQLLPRAERLVYRVPDEQLVLGVAPDRAQYTPGGKVRLELSARNERKQAVPAVLMVGVVNRSVIAMADNKTDRLLPTHFLLSGEVRHPSELEHADFLLTDHPQAAIALDLLLATQGWRRFAEQTGAALNAADHQEVDRMLIAHGQAPTAPVELRKLEEQRIASEYRPKIEAAVLKTVEDDKRSRNVTTPLKTAVVDLQQAELTIKSEYGSAKSEFEKVQSRSISTLIVSAIAFLAILAVASILIIESKRVASGNLHEPIAVVILSICFFSFLFLLIFSSQSNKNAPSEVAYKRGTAKGPSTPSAPDLGLQSNLDAALPTPESVVKQTVDAVVTEDNLGQPNAPDTDPAALKLPGFPSSDMAFSRKEKHITIAKDPNFALPDYANFEKMMRARKGVAIPNGGIEQSNVFGIDLGLQSNLESALPDLLAVPPTIVREYAHQRDPALGAVRSDFTETVYWHPVLIVPDSGKTSIEFQLSDDIARYQVLVAGHTLDGRIGAVATTLEARKPFSIDPKLPAEISHTDRVDVPVRITNDSDVSRNLTLALTSSGPIAADRTGDMVALGPIGKTRRIFPLKATALEGEATVLASASEGNERDAIVRKLRVVPDGFPGVGSLSDTLEGKTRGVIVLPKDVVPGSLAVRLEVYPTTLSDLLKGLDGLLREPSGCFEQTSTTNYPNVMILDYLNQSNQADPQASRRARQHLDQGYARLTKFECPDTPLQMKHGFEWFGAADMAHEALTAYGLLQFKDMARVHPVDPVLIKRTQEFLLSRKDGAGGFLRNDRHHHTFGDAPKYTHDAYIVWALVESDPDDRERLDLAKEIAALKSLAMPEESAAGKDAYFLALTANILLVRGDREAANRLLDRLVAKHLKDGAVTGAVTSITRSGGRDLLIETTALALLGWLRANDPTYAPAIRSASKWIGQQRGGYGGFGSTQSTILALKALALYAKKSAHPAESGEVTVRANGQVAGTRKFTERDVETIALDIDKPETLFKPGERIEVEVATDGKQPYPFTLSYTYTTLTPLSADECAVRIATRLAKSEAWEGDTVPLFVSMENREKQGQGMAVAIVGIPAGMKAPTDLKQLTDLREKGQIAFFELRGRELILYWRELAPGQKIDLTIDLVCDVPGRYRGPASRGYLYYNADHKHWVEPLAITITPMGSR